jgi:hypothetical protein
MRPPKLDLIVNLTYKKFNKLQIKKPVGDRLLA